MLAEYLKAEIISVDSTLVYTGLDIGSAKPTLAERRGIPHHLMDIRDPTQIYSVADFRQDAQEKINLLLSKKKVPLLVGGTMLYFKVLLEGLVDLPPADAAIRAEIETRAEKQGWPALHEELAQVDPVTAQRLHPNHSQRITRALEVFQLTGQALSVLQQRGNEGGLLSKYRIVQLALLPGDRKLLHLRIEQRFRRMLDQGFEQEVQKLFERDDLHEQLPSVRAVGYRQLWGYLSGEYNFEVSVEKGIAATRQLAKRQLTWLRSWPDLYSLPCDDMLTSTKHEQKRKLTEIRDQALNYIELTTI